MKCAKNPMPGGTAVFGEAVALVADALGVELDEIVCEAQYAKTTEDVTINAHSFIVNRFK